jgi:hypothetical protein
VSDPINTFWLAFIVIAGVLLVLIITSLCPIFGLELVITDESPILMEDPPDPPPPFPIITGVGG